MRFMCTYITENLHLPTECKEKAFYSQVEAEAVEGRWDHGKCDDVLHQLHRESLWQ